MSAHSSSVELASGWFRHLSLSYKSGLGIVLLVALLTHLPFSGGVLATDDYMIRAMISGDSALFEAGFTKADPDKGFWQGLNDAFHFYSPDEGTVQQYREYGNLAWWSSDDARMNPWRPLSALTHWVDFQIAPASYNFQLMHSLVYVLLFAYCAYGLFWRLSDRSSIAVLAAILLMVDFSHLVNFNWVAARNVFIVGALGCASLHRFLIWREAKTTASLLISLSLFVLTLLSAESSIAITGYFFAWLWLVERMRAGQIVRTLFPFAVVVVAWRLVYNVAGFGADNISLYVDPVRDPAGFLASVVQSLPLRIASLILTVDSTMASMSATAKIWASLVSLLFVLACLWLIRPLLKSSPLVRFMLTGSVLAAIPACALITVGPRAGLFTSIGFFWVLSVWLHSLMAPHRSKVWKTLAGMILCLHVFLPMLLGFVYTSRLLPVVFKDDMEFESVERPLHEANGQLSLVVLNTPAPNTQFYLPFEWQLAEGVFPQSVNMLVPGFTTFDLKRLSLRDFEMHAPSGFPLSGGQPVRDLEGQEKTFSAINSYNLVQGLMTNDNDQYRAGQTFRSGDMLATVQTVENGMVTRVHIRFDDDVEMNNLVWQRYDWTTRQYHSMDAPEVGDKLRVAGPLDMQSSNQVQLCLGCEDDAS